MAGGIIIHRKGGQNIPESYLERVLNNNPKALGMIGIDKQSGMKLERFNDVPSLEDFKKALAVDKREAFLWFGLYPSTFDTNDIQPFLLLGEEDDPLLAIMMEGDFVATTTGSSHLDVWHVAEELREEIKTLYDLCGEDLDKLMIALRSKSQFNNFANKIKTNGSMLFLPSDGEEWMVSKDNKFERKFDWGWTSNVLGWNPSKEIAKDNASERPTAKSFADAFGKTPIITPAATAEKEQLLDGKGTQLKDYPDDTEPPLWQPSSKVIANARLKELRKLCTAMSWNKQCPPELEMTPDGKAVTDKSQIAWAKVWVVTKERHLWHEKQREKDKPVVVEKPATEAPTGKTLSAKEKLALKRAAEAAAKAEAEKPAVVEPEPVEKIINPDPGREFVPIPTPESQDAVETLIAEIIIGERKIPAPKAAKEMDKVRFTERFGLTSVTEVKFEDGDLWTLVTKHPSEAYLLLKEAMASLEKLTPAQSADTAQRKAG